MRVWAASFAGAVVVLGGLASTAAKAATAATPMPPDVTIIGDSVMTAVYWHPKAVAIMQKGLQVRWEVAVCRTLDGLSCPFDGERPPTLLEVVAADGDQLGKIVVVEDGYNDPGDTFAQGVDDSIDALLAAGVEKILWVNLHQATPELAAMNEVLDEAAARYPELTLLDWNSYASGHNDWFQTDLIHLTTAGGIGLATMLHAAVLKAQAPPLLAGLASLPAARVGRPYLARIQARGGRPPYSWRAVSGPLPRGLHLRPNGRIDGVPRRACRFTVTFQATDSDGVAVLEQQQIRVVRG